MTGTVNQSLWIKTNFQVIICDKLVLRHCETDRWSGVVSILTFTNRQDF